jgi:predicted regulator of Ras-like GTPase activity (Roadblock/LC7/MglB family)
MSMHAEDDSNPERLMANLKSQVSGVRGAVLSAHGLGMAGHGLGPDAVDELAAVSSGLFSHARQAVRAFGQNPDGGVRQVAIEMDGLTLFAASAGAAGILTVLAERETDAAVLGSEIGRVIERLQPFLATQPRVRDAVARMDGSGPQG